MSVALVSTEETPLLEIPAANNHFRGFAALINHLSRRFQEYDFLPPLDLVDEANQIAINTRGYKAENVIVLNTRTNGEARQLVEDLSQERIRAHWWQNTQHKPNLPYAATVVVDASTLTEEKVQAVKQRHELALAKAEAGKPQRARVL